MRSLLRCALPALLASTALTVVCNANCIMQYNNTGLDPYFGPKTRNLDPGRLDLELGTCSSQAVAMAKGLSLPCTKPHTRQALHSRHAWYGSADHGSMGSEVLNQDCTGKQQPPAGSNAIKYLLVLLLVSASSRKQQ